jgi:hypothetical protein
VRKVRAVFPEAPDVRLLLRTRAGSNSYALYGFKTGTARCLRLVATGEDRGTATSCTSVAELENAADPVVLLRANVSFGNGGGHPPTVPNELATFGFVATDVARVDVVSDEGSRTARVANGGFLQVVDAPPRRTWARRVVAFSRQGDERTIPIAVLVDGQPTGIPKREPTGPADVDRRVTGGTIGWLDRGEPRGQSLHDAAIQVPPHMPIGAGARVVTPDPGDFLRMIVDKRGSAICSFLVERGSIGGGCMTGDVLARTPLAVGWGFAAAGSQQAVVSGLASDDVRRIELFLADGSRRPVALADNVAIARAPIGLFPVRVVAYDDEGRVIGVTTLPAFRP